MWIGVVSKRQEISGECSNMESNPVGERMGCIVQFQGVSYPRVLYGARDLGMCDPRVYSSGGYNYGQVILRGE